MHNKMTVLADTIAKKSRRGLGAARLLMGLSAFLLVTSVIAVVLCTRVEWSRSMPYLMWVHVAILLVFGAGALAARRLHSDSSVRASPRPRELFAPWVVVVALASVAAAAPNWAGIPVGMGKSPDGTKVTSRHWHTSADGTRFYESINRGAPTQISQAEYEELERGNFAAFARVWVLFSFISLVMWRFIALRRRDELLPVARATEPNTSVPEGGTTRESSATNGEPGWQSTAAIASIWCLTIVSNMLGFVAAPDDMVCAMPMSSQMATLVVAMPLVFFVGMALFTKRSPFLSPWIAGLVDEKFGVGSCERFVVRLKPLLLFAAAGLLGAAATAASCWRSGAGDMDWTAPLPLFLASGSIAFAIAHFVMRFRRVPGI
ncbi:putative transmembrane protein [Variovorax paradoxus B4]|uniref:Putative transmembrane protein n=1 Tax=Variovorax paradoxus B4 TaxID=1246301 RepID=T1X3A8_VARPD|nr:putative transmembrane protein [Variovorax paradoxus B4]